MDKMYNELMYKKTNSITNYLILLGFVISPRIAELATTAGFDR